LGAVIIGCVVYGIQLGWGCVVSGLVYLTSSGFSSGLLFSVGGFNTYAFPLQQWCNACLVYLQESHCIYKCDALT